MAKTKKRPDKIFNNSYYHGNKKSNDTHRYDDKMEIQTEDAFTQNTVSAFNPETAYPYDAILETILGLVNGDDQIQEILKNNKKKFNKAKINVFFQLVLDHFNSTIELKRIKEHIYIFDIISKLTGIRALNLFDLLELEYKQYLLDELNESYNIYKNYNRDNKFF